MTEGSRWRSGAGVSRALGITAMLAAGLGMTAPGCGAGSDAPTSARAIYSVMTYNIGGKPGITGYSLDNGSSCEERAAQIGQHILDLPDPPDILVFAEATGDCYKDGLIDKLNTNGPYRSFITDFGAGSPKLQDSGLMFFSKFPWKLKDDDDSCPDMDLVGEVLNPVGQPVFGQASGIFHEFTDLASDDRYMAKGIAYACVHNPATKQLIHVFFTHNQANYWIPGDKDFDDLAHKERAVNMEEASKFINAHAPESITSKRGEAVIFAGDMNIYGNDIAYWLKDLTGKDPVPGSEIEEVIPPARVDGMHEYADLIAPGGLFDTANGLRDPWRTDGTAFPALTVFDDWGMNNDMGVVYDPVAVNKTDMGFTWDALRNGQTENDETRARLDYILDRQVAFHEALDCFEQMTVERGFVYTANPNVKNAYVGADLSDHYPLRAVIGPDEPLCSPSRAPIDKLGAIPITVVNAGARKWLFYSAPGTYVIDASTTSPLEVHVYAASDLSTNLVPREGDTTIDAGTLMGDKRQNDPVTFKAGAPFYVMLAYKDRDTTGSFTLEIRKNNCASWDEAEWLDPFAAAHMAMSGPPAGAPQTACYFKLRQDEALSIGGNVDVQAMAASLLNSDNTAAIASLALYRSDHSPVMVGAVGAGTATLATALAPSSDFLYLVAERPTANQQMTFDIVWTRNVTTIDIARFVVVNQDDDNGGDEVKIFWSIEDAGHDVWPVDPDSNTANGQSIVQMTYYYDGLASGASSPAPQIQCATWCPLAPSLADSHHVNIAFPDALWGLAWEIDDSSPDDALFHDVSTPSHDGRFRITALDPDPANWIHPGDLDHGALVYAKALWRDLATYSRGYRLDATRKMPH